MRITEEEIRHNCERARDLMRRSREQGFAVGAFNIDNQETLIAVCRAAKAKNSPVLVEVSDGEVKALGLHNVRDMVDNYKREYGIEIYINLDHSPSVEAAKAGIDAGFEFIHIDVSQANHDATDEEIITATREVVEYAKKTDALVESEPHYFMGSSNLHTEAIDYEEIKRRFRRPRAPRRSLTPPASTPLQQPSATCMASTRCRSSWIWTCCAASAKPLTATSACTAAAARPAIISRKRPRSA
jgi:Fructose/tagatose bisphosphate aldolase